MYGIVATDPGEGEVVAVSSGQSLDEVTLLVAVDWRQVGPFKQTVALEVTREERVAPCLTHCIMTGCVSSCPHLGFSPRLRAVDEDETLLSEAGPAVRAVELPIYKKTNILNILLLFILFTALLWLCISNHLLNLFIDTEIKFNIYEMWWRTMYMYKSQYWSKCT